MTEASRFSDLLIETLAGICRLSEPQIGLLYSHYQLLVRWNKVLNLTAIRDLDEAVVRHYSESLFLGTHLPGGSLSVADLGSGGGFPGIPIAVLRPECRITLIESHQRKAVFLKECTRDYRNVLVIPKRAEDVRESFDWLVSRAVRWADVLTWAPRLSGRIGLLLSAKDAAKLLKNKAIASAKAHPLPWDNSKVLVIGECVSRGTWVVDCDVKHDSIV
jgi:16S rRNA (guanine(527)-N(7))-methyltransferase RsmG